MSHQCYFEEEENAKEESIDNYCDLFIEYQEKPPTLKEALNQLFTSGGVPENELDNYINDIVYKAGKVFTERKKDINEKYPKITLEEASVITSYTCEALQKKFNPYKILNKNLVSDDRKQGLQNVSKYFYLLLMTLRKLPRCYPDKQLYRCIDIIVHLNDPFNKKYVPYELGKEKTFWAFTSTSTNNKSSYDFLGKKSPTDNYKRGTIFSLSGNIWGYDIKLFSCYPKEEEILLEPERKYIIKEIYPEVNDILIIRGEFKDTPNVLKDIILSNELIYEVDSNGYYDIFDSSFVENNKNNIDLIINGEGHEFNYNVYLQKGKNIIKLITKNKITNLSTMFYRVNIDILNIDSLKNLDVSNVIDFSAMFWGRNLTNINGLLNWKVSKGKNFSHMFEGCGNLSNINGLQNWDVSNGNNFSFMFSQCTSLSDIKPLQNWKVYNGNNFSVMFKGTQFSDIKSLQNWNVSNGNNFSYMFYGCDTLSNINGLQNWDVSNGNNFEAMFNYCKSLSDIKPLYNWNVSNGNNFQGMFSGCCSLSNINGLQNWDVSNGNDFSLMFSQCTSLSDIKHLQKWNVSNGKYFRGMFYKCYSLSDFEPLQNWIKLNSSCYLYGLKNI